MEAPPYRLAELAAIQSLPRYNGEGGPHMRWKGHKEWTLHEAFVACSVFFFIKCQKIKNSI